jgi:probable rRNA maturation factor
MIDIIITEAYRDQVDLEPIEDAARLTLLHEEVHGSSEMTIAITGDEQLRALNRQYLNIDAPTDVLSFPVDFLDPENENQYVGDIAISYPRAVNQAALGGHSVIAEIQLLVVHGVLHLLGHDHAEPSEKTAMWAAQKKILRQLGIDSLKLPDGEGKV